MLAFLQRWCILLLKLKMSVVIVGCRVYMSLVRIGLLQDFIVMNVVMKLNFIGLMMNSFAQIVLRRDQKGLNTMTEKNRQKEEAKKYRNLWTMNPITRIVESRKKYKRSKDRKDKKLYED